MALGVPVISSNTGGIPEVNKHGYSGYLSNVGDIEDMAINAKSILQNETVLQQFKQQAWKHAQTFKIENVLPVYEALYKEVLSFN
jgi:glycosyltransferase involved in cell wall biosynthesis